MAPTRSTEGWRPDSMGQARTRSCEISLAAALRIGAGDTRGDDLALLDFLGQPRLGGAGLLVLYAGARRAGNDVAAAAAQHEREADGDQRADDRPREVHPVTRPVAAGQGGAEGAGRVHRHAA